MDFENVNPLNIQLNKLSGNLLSMTEHESSFTFFWKLYGVFVTMTELLLMMVVIPGSIYVPRQKFIKDGTIALTTILEASFIILRIHACQHQMRRLIGMLNRILHDADNTMRSIVTKTLQSTQVPLKFYAIAGVISTILWSSLPLLLIPNKSVFWNVDHKIPTYLPKQPYSLKVFILCNLFLTLGCMYIMLKKVAADVYMIHLVLLMTAQYRYIATKMIFQESEHDDGNNLKKRLPPVNEKQDRKMMALCRHHNAVIRIMILLKELLSLNYSVIYINSIFRFSFIAISLNEERSIFWETVIVFFHMLGAIVQLYIACSCVQTLLDASTEITDKAFHEDWYFCKPSIKRKFMFMIMANNLKCKISKIGNFNLSLSSFMKIINQSYSIAVMYSKFN